MLRAQGAAVKVGVLHPVSGALSYSGQQGRIGAQLAIEEINAAGGIKALGGAKIEAVLGDAQSTPDGGNAEVEKMNAAGVAAIVGGYASGICLAASQTAARYDLPYIVDVGVVDSIVTRGLKNTFRFGPGFGVIAKTALDNLVTINDQAGKAAKTVMIVHEDSAFGSGLAKLLNAQLPERGFQVLETIPHPTPTRDFNNVVLKIRAQNPDLVIPANYYNEYVLLARTMQQQRVRPKGIYSVLGGAASSYKFVKEFPEAAQYIMDCNHWFDPKNAKALELKKKVDAKGEFYTYEVYMNYSCILLLADALERAASADRAKIITALEGSTFAGHAHALWPDQVRQRPEPRRGCRSTPRCSTTTSGDLPGRVRIRQGGVPDAARPDMPAEAAHRSAAWPAVRHAVIGHPHSGGAQRTDDRRRLCAGGARADADLRRPAHHQFRAWRAADRRDVRGVLRAPAARPRSLSRRDRPDAAVLSARLRPAALRHRPGRAWRGPQHPAGDARPRRRHRERAALRFPRRHPHDQPALRLRRGRDRHRVPRGSARHRLRVVIAVALALWLIMRWTDTGKAIRAVAKEKLGAELSGIDVAHIYAVTFGLGTACLAIAACLLIPTYYVNPHAGNAFVLIAFTIVVLGGMGSVPGALIGGLFVGVVESLSGLYLGESLGQIGIFVMFILVLLFRPSGLFGERA